MVSIKRRGAGTSPTPLDATNSLLYPSVQKTRTPLPLLAVRAELRADKAASKAAGLCTSHLGACVAKHLGSQTSVSHKTYFRQPRRHGIVTCGFRHRIYVDFLHVLKRHTQSHDVTDGQRFSTGYVSMLFSVPFSAHRCFTDHGSRSAPGRDRL